MPGKSGNKNALKHGFYAKRLSASEKERAEGVDSGDFSGGEGCEDIAAPGNGSDDGARNGFVRRDDPLRF